MAVVKTGVLKVAPTKATEVKAASLYQVKIGLVTIEVTAVNNALDPAQIVASVAATSPAPAIGVTVSPTARALPEAFSHLLSPLQLHNKWC